MTTQPQIVFIHGFLGVPEDWTEYVDYFKQLGYETKALELEECELGQIHKSVNPGAHLVGYSMGGRVALLFSSLKPDFFSSLTLISTNPGLLSKEEREHRSEWEEEWLSKMERMPIDEFVHEWYSQSLFCSFRPPARRYRQNKDSMIKTFRKFSIANLPSLWDHLLRIPCRVQMIFGRLDGKYMNIKRKIEEIDTEKRIALKTISNRSHSLHLEASHQILRQIGNFIRK